MLAYKFLLSGAVGPFSGFVWPTPAGGAPGPWVDGAAAPATCRAGVHGCQVHDLPWWLQDELWVAEFDDPVRLVGRKVVSSRARLMGRIDAWGHRMSLEFAEACARRARDHAAAALDRAGESGAASELLACETPNRVREVGRALDVPEIARVSMLMAIDGATRAITGPTATAAYIAAHAARHLDGAEAMDRERRWQANWLARRLGLSEARA